MFVVHVVHVVGITCLLCIGDEFMIYLSYGMLVVYVSVMCVMSVLCIMLCDSWRMHMILVICVYCLLVCACYIVNVYNLCYM